MKNETNPTEIMTLSVTCLQALEHSQASPGEKVAALRTAAFAIEQAVQAQQMAVLVANLINQTKAP